MIQYSSRFQFVMASLPLLIVLILALAVTGCGGATDARSLSVNEPGARDALQTVLLGWKDGKKAQDLAPIVAKDSDWDQGRTLESFEIQPGERTDGANLFMKVKRKVKTPKGTVLDQEVEYVVGTSPVVTVFRSDQ